MTKRRKRPKRTADEDRAKVEAFLRGEAKTVTKLPAAYADGAVRGPSVKPRTQTRKKRD
jgi:hypothetical protein